MLAIQAPRSWRLGGVDERPLHAATVAHAVAQAASVRICMRTPRTSDPNMRDPGPRRRKSRQPVALRLHECVIDAAAAVTRRRGPPLVFLWRVHGRGEWSGPSTGDYCEIVGADR